jgi:CheY-like chemotaxis protein
MTDDIVYAKEPSKPHTFQILILDDDTTNRKVASMLINDCTEYKAHAVATYEEFQLEYMTDKYDLLLLDICLDGDIRGTDICKQIREAEKTTGRHIPIIAYTALDDPEELYAAGFDDILIKPITLNLVRAELNFYLDNKDWRKSGGKGGGRSKL